MLQQASVLHSLSQQMQVGIVVLLDHGDKPRTLLARSAAGLNILDRRLVHIETDDQVTGWDVNAFFSNCGCKQAICFAVLESLQDTLLLVFGDAGNVEECSLSTDLDHN